jgi:hypothetical protein
LSKEVLSLFIGVYMARPVKDTPVLTGKDAREFDAWLATNQDKKISEAKKAKILAAGKKFKLLNV